MSSLDKVPPRRQGRLHPRRRRGHRLGPSLRLASAGADVPWWSGRASWAEPAAQKVRDAGCRALVVGGDMTREEDADRRGGRDPGRASAASTSSSTPIAAGPARCSSRPLSTARRLGLDLRAERASHPPPTQAAARAMIAAGNGGGSLNISSVRAQLGINAATRPMWRQSGRSAPSPARWLPNGRRTASRSTHLPTFVDTPQVAMLLDDRSQEGRGVRHPPRRVGTPDDLTGGGLFFAPMPPRFVTGQILTIDGGLTATQ